jgi:hypothetical protein
MLLGTDVSHGMFDGLKVREEVARLSLPPSPPLTTPLSSFSLPPQAICHIEAEEIRKGIEFMQKGRPFVSWADLPEERR